MKRTTVDEDATAGPQATVATHAIPNEVPLYELWPRTSLTALGLLLATNTAWMQLANRNARTLLSTHPSLTGLSQQYAQHLAHLLEDAPDGPPTLGGRPWFAYLAFLDGMRAAEASGGRVGLVTYGADFAVTLPMRIAVDMAQWVSALHERYLYAPDGRSLISYFLARARAQIYGAPALPPDAPIRWEDKLRTALVVDPSTGRVHLGILKRVLRLYVGARGGHADAIFDIEPKYSQWMINSLERGYENVMNQAWPGAIAAGLLAMVDAALALCDDRRRWQRAWYAFTSAQNARWKYYSAHALLDAMGRAANGTERLVLLTMEQLVLDPTRRAASMLGITPVCVLEWLFEQRRTLAVTDMALLERIVAACADSLDEDLVQRFAIPARHVDEQRLVQLARRVGLLTAEHERERDAWRTIIGHCLVPRGGV